MKNPKTDSQNKQDHIKLWNNPIVQSILPQQHTPREQIHIATLLGCDPTDRKTFPTILRQLLDIMDFDIPLENVHSFDLSEEVRNLQKEALKHHNASEVKIHDEPEFYIGTRNLLLADPNKRWLIFGDFCHLYKAQAQIKYLKLFQEFPNQIIGMFINVVNTRVPKVNRHDIMNKMKAYALKHNISYAMSPYHGFYGTPMNDWFFTKYKIPNEFKISENAVVPVSASTGSPIIPKATFIPEIETKEDIRNGFITRTIHVRGQGPVDFYFDKIEHYNYAMTHGRFRRRGKYLIFELLETGGTESFLRHIDIEPRTRRYPGKVDSDFRESAFQIYECTQKSIQPTKEISVINKPSSNLITIDMLSCEKERVQEFIQEIIRAYNEDLPKLLCIDQTLTDAIAALTELDRLIKK